MGFMQTMVTFIYLFTCTSAASLLTHDDECLALFEFKQTHFHQVIDASFNHSGGFQKFKSWRKMTSNASDNNPSDCCLWNGVFCSSEGHVTGLDLSESSLRGRINSSSSLFKLVHLRKLNLSMNDFAESCIPLEIASLKQLRILDLSNSSFVGQIPKEISHLEQLSVLDLSWNPLKLQNYSLGYLLKNMTRLEKLHLSEVHIGSYVPLFLANFSSMRSIHLGDCHLRDEFPSTIFHLPQLKYLDMRNNPDLTGSLPEFHNNTLLEEMRLFNTSFIGIIPESISNLNHLKVLRLSECHFSGALPSSFSNLTELAILGLEGNKFSGQVPSSIFHLPQLQRLGFSGIIPESICNLKHLQVLELSKCHFMGLIPGSISNLTQLTYLGLEHNNFRGHVPSLGSLSKLDTLALSDSNFENERFPYWLSKLTTLNELYLNRMNIYDKIPSSLANLTRLSHVSMGYNNIYGGIPSWFMNLTQLNLIYFESNQLQGPISSDFSNFKSLEYLNLYSNNFSGRVELDTFAGLNKLETLFLGFNKISFVSTNKYNYTNGGILPNLKSLALENCNLKEFPAFLRFQKNMKSLTLRENKIEGLVPVWIWNNSQETMQLIDLAFNFITGFQHHPRFLPWVNLEVLMIQNNQLQGRLPHPPHTIIDYNLSYNKLIGEIPASLCEAKSLQLLDLSFNNLKGTLPSCFGSLSNSLSVLNLKRNNFHGTMMNACTHGSMLKMIDLSQNRFTGQLSKSIANCITLEVLSLGDNSFDDYFPSWLGALPQLQVLSLRSNKFHGEIQGPKSDTTQFSKLRIIDLSNNTFSGQLPVKCIQSWKAMKSVYVGESVAINFGLKLNDSLWTYDYSMTLTNKGVKTEYVKILKLFIVIDLSCNNFEGPIPQQLQYLQGVQSLNLSNNHLSGCLLPYLGNLKNLESLDLSHNKLSGEIPQELLQLGFLAILNVSFNHLDGRIPQGKQFNTFENSSYAGNPGLCGKPLSKECQNSNTSILPPPSSKESEFESLLPSEIIDWIVILTAIASGLVIGIVTGNILYARYSDWFIDQFGMKKDRWVRPPSNMRRN